LQRVAACHEADIVEVTDHNAVRLKERGLYVGNLKSLGVLTDDLACLGQVRASHAGEQVVLNLVVEATHEGGGPPAAADVTRGAHLLGEEVQLGGPRDDRHAFVVGSERGTHVEAKHSQLHDNKRKAHANGHLQEHG